MAAALLRKAQLRRRILLDATSTSDRDFAENVVSISKSQKLLFVSKRRPSFPAVDQILSSIENNQVLLEAC